MTRMVKCVKLDKESEGLAQVPYPGELGRRIYAHVSHVSKSLSGKNIYDKVKG